jgi:hypothetical protein
VAIFHSRLVDILRREGALHRAPLAPSRAGQRGFDASEEHDRGEDGEEDVEDLHPSLTVRALAKRLVSDALGGL